MGGGSKRWVAAIVLTTGLVSSGCGASGSTPGGSPPSPSTTVSPKTEAVLREEVAAEVRRACDEALVAGEPPSVSFDDRWEAVTTAEDLLASAKACYATEATTTSEVPPTASTTTTVSTTTTEAVADDVLRPDGIGPLRIGMSLDEAIATGFVKDPRGGLAEAIELYGFACLYASPANSTDPPPWSALFADFDGSGAIPLHRIYVDSASVRTVDSLGIGSRVAEIRAAHPSAAALYEGEYGGYELLFTEPGGGFVYSFDSPEGPATSVSVGDLDGLSLVEGCL